MNELHPQDEELKMLRWAGIALAGFYAFRVFKKQGTLTGILQNPESTRQKAHGLIEVLGQHLGNHVKQPAARSMLQSLGHQLVDKLIDDKLGKDDGE